MIINDLSKVTEGIVHTHTTAATAEEVTPSSSAGSFLRIWSEDSVWVGDTKINAEAHRVGAPQNTVFVVRLTNKVTTLWIDTGTGKKVWINVIFDPRIVY